MNKNLGKYLVSSTLVLLTSNTLQFLLALYVLNSTGSATLFSTILAVVIIPRVLVTPYAGIWGDKFDKKILMKIYISLYAGIYFLFAVLLKCLWEYSVILVFMFVVLVEIIETLYSSVNSSMIPLIVEEADISSATGYATVGESVASILAPVFGALLFGKLGIYFSIIILSAINVLALSVFKYVDLRRYEIDEEVSESNFELIRATAIILKENVMLRRVVILAPLINFFLSPILSVTYPFYLNELIGVSSYQYGVFESISGFALVIGGVVSIKLLKKREYNDVLKKAILGIGSGIFIQLILITVTKETMDSYILLIISATGIYVLLAIMNVATSTMFKQQVPIRHMGRVTAFVNLLATILLPLGQILYGLLADNFEIVISFVFAFLGMFGIYMIVKKLK